MMKNQRWIISLFFVATMIGLATANALAADGPGQHDAQLSLLQQKYDFFGGPTLQNVFIILFLSIGPLGVIPAFAKLTAGADSKLRNRLAFRGFWVATLTVVVVAFIGLGLLANYRVSLNALLTAAGLILAIVATRSILGTLGVKHKSDQPPAKPDMSMAISPLAFPIILPPFSIAIVLLLLIIGERIGVNVYTILGFIIALTVVDFIGMIFSQGAMKVLRPEFLQVLGVVLSVVKLAIAITWIYGGIALEVGSIMAVIGSGT